MARARIVSGIALVVLARCEGPQLVAPIPPQEERVAPGLAAAPPSSDSELALGEVQAFCGELARQAVGGAVGFFPLPQREAPGGRGSVSRLGEELARRCAREFAEVRTDAPVFDPREMFLRLMDVRRGAVLVERLEDAVESGARCGVEVVVFGNIQRLNRSRFGEELRVEIYAVDVTHRSVLGEAAFTIRDRAAQRRAFRLAGIPSAVWAEPAREDGESPLTLDAELSSAAKVLVRRLSRRVDLATFPLIYVAPTATPPLRDEIAACGALRSAFDREIARRDQAHMPPSEPFELADRIFPGLDAAGAYWRETQDRIMEGAAGQFGLELSHRVIGALFPLVGREIPPRLWDLCMAQSNLQLDPEQMECQIASGDLTVAPSVHRNLRKLGVDLMVVPVLLSVGDGHVLRITAYDLVRVQVSATESYCLTHPFQADLIQTLRSQVAR